VGESDGILCAYVQQTFLGCVQFIDESIFRSYGRTFAVLTYGTTYVLICRRTSAAARTSPPFEDSARSLEQPCLLAGTATRPRRDRCLLYPARTLVADDRRGGK
jgi:hypothetical protein